MQCPLEVPTLLAMVAPTTIDVTDATFQAEVIDRSHQVAVVVDLWAEWCGPCKALGPVIEDVVAEFDGKVLLAKVDVDANPGIAQAFQVQSIPAVYGLVDGKVAGNFVGAQGADAVRTLVVISDAPPQRYPTAFGYREAMLQASAQGIRLLPVAASGADREGEFLFRAMATTTSSPYVYLTDDSGIGNPHMEADTDRVAVEYFHDLLTRLVIDDLHGQGMHEAI